MQNTNSFHRVILTLSIVFISFLGYERLQYARSSLLRKLSGPYADVFPDSDLVVDLMQLSNDIFDESTHYESTFSNPNFDFQLWVEANFSTEFLIVTSKRDGKTVVVFRGSEEYDDWLTNVNIMLVKSKFVNAPSSVKLHRGFQRALFNHDVSGGDVLVQSVIDIVEEKVLELSGDNGDVILSGHSLGGANAHITAAYLADKYPNMKVQMVNFGAPRLGNKAFKTWTEKSLSNLSAWRYVFRNDIVPRLIIDTFGYRHAGHLFQMNRFNSKVYYRQRGKSGVYKKAPRSWYCEFQSFSWQSCI